MFHPGVDGRGDGGAIDEKFAFGFREQATGEDLFHGAIIADHGNDDLGQRRDGFKVGGGAMEFLRQGLRHRGVDVMDSGDDKTRFLKAAGHVGPHAPDSNEANFR